LSRFGTIEDGMRVPGFVALDAGLARFPALL
jgi:hypothetical protein